MNIMNILVMFIYVSKMMKVLIWMIKYYDVHFWSVEIFQNTQTCLTFLTPCKCLIPKL